jgi:hypothetical protein
MSSTITRIFAVFAPLALVAVAGCQGTVALIPNNDPELRSPPSSFAADAAKRHYEADAQRVPDSQFRAQYALIMKEIDLANISNLDWVNVEVWINEKYVVYCRTFDAKSSKSLKFTMFYDHDGHPFDTQGGTNPIEKVEVFRGGTMYAVVAHVAD